MPKNALIVWFAAATLVWSACGNAGDDSTAPADADATSTTFPDRTDPPPTTIESPDTTAGVPSTTAPSTTVPSTTVPSTTVPPTTVPPTTVAAASEPDTTEPPSDAESERVCLGDPPDESRCWLQLDASSDRPAPLIVDLHGFTMTGGIQQDVSFIEAIARRERLVAVWPDSPDLSWNSGICCGDAHAENRDDVGFIDALIAGLIADGSVDPERVYLSGFSNGCSLAQRIAVERSDRIAAVACFSDYLEIEPPDALVGIPILQIHGTADRVVPYDPAPGFVGALENAAIWAQLNQCAPTPDIVEDGQLVTHRYGDCAQGAEVVHLQVIEGTHGRFHGLLNTDTLWEFLDRH